MLKLTYEHLSSQKNFLGSLTLAMQGRGREGEGERGRGGEGEGRGRGREGDGAGGEGERERRKEEFGPPPRLAPGSAYGRGAPNDTEGSGPHLT